MRTFIEDRAKLVMAAIVIIVAIVGYLIFAGGGPDATQQAKRVEDTILQPKRGAEDVSAQSLLQSAALAMESWWSTNQTFAGSATGMASIEPNIAWTTGGAATAAANQVAVTLGPDQMSYTLTTAAASGTNFTYARDAQAEIQRTCGAGCTW